MLLQFQQDAPWCLHPQPRLLCHTRMAANVDLVTGDSASGSGNPTDSCYAQMSISLHLSHHYQPKGSRPADLRPILPIHQPTILLNRTTRSHSTQTIPITGNIAKLILYIIFISHFFMIHDLWNESWFIIVAYYVHIMYTCIITTHITNQTQFWNVQH